MQVSLFNSRNPNGKRIPVNITLEIIDEVNTKDGDVIYKLSFYTGAKDKDTHQQVIPVSIIQVTKHNILEEINKGLTQIAERIDWGSLEDDIHSPIITNITPQNNENNVSMDRIVSITLKDPFPASFIDISTLKFKVNGIEVTNELILKEKNNELILNWIPTKVYE